MQLTHTSPVEITSIDTHGRFGEFLFFAHDEYVMTAGAHITYTIDLADDAVIQASQLFYHHDAERLSGLVAEVANRYDIDEADAEALIDESKSIYDIDSNVEAEDLGEASWDIQRFTACAAKLLGFRAVAVSDEQGTSYLVDMLGHEADLAKK
ncbi:hypothetical protein I5P84_03475 [Pseudomonas mosselii]|nr:hypothetical protein [Pseudomonas mosselii]MBH3308518.1 hypothetical protein [Pseudomonas mosselii]